MGAFMRSSAAFRQHIAGLPPHMRQRWAATVRIGWYVGIAVCTRHDGQRLGKRPADHTCDALSWPMPGPCPALAPAFTRALTPCPHTLHLALTPHPLPSHPPRFCFVLAVAVVSGIFAGLLIAVHAVLPPTAAWTAWAGILAAYLWYGIVRPEITYAGMQRSRAQPTKRGTDNTRTLTALPAHHSRLSAPPHPLHPPSSHTLVRLHQRTQPSTK